MKLLLCLLILVSSMNVFAKRFSNSYAEFELPPGWECMIEGSEWVCQSTNEQRKKEAIIILAAKKRGQQDTLAQYQTYLKKVKTYELPGAKTQRSEPKSVTMQTINKHQWVDALHLASEVPGFYTRYLATVKADIGVAITFSVTKSLYNAYKGIFDKVAASLRVFRQENKNLSNLRIKKRSKGAAFDDATFVPQDTFDVGQAAQTKKRKTDDGGDDLMLYGLGAVVAFFVMRKLKGGKKKKVVKKKKKKKASKKA